MEHTDKNRQNRQESGSQNAAPLPASPSRPAPCRTRWGEKPYYSLDFYLKETFGRKVYKLALDGGMTCPNRDGTLGTGGCIFCSEGGSGDFAQQAAGDFSLPGIHAQIERAKERVALKIKDGKYIAYFQSFTNTYAPVPYLERLFSGALSHPDVIALSVGTRPDCLSPETVELLKKLNREKPVWVELGLQTIHERTARLIRRGYELPCFLDAFRRLKEAGLTVIVHVILGLPGESREDMLKTVRFIGNLALDERELRQLERECFPERFPEGSPQASSIVSPLPDSHCSGGGSSYRTAHVDGIKLQLLHMLRGTELARMYEKHPFPVMEPEEYFSLIADCIRFLPEDIVVHRISGDGPKRLLIAPQWSADKRFVLNSIARTLKETGAFQGQWAGRT